MSKAFDKENLKSILLHEIAHAVWDSSVDPSYKAKWIRLYDRNMERKSVASKEIIQLRLDLLESGMTVNDYIKNMEDGDAMKRLLTELKSCIILNHSILISLLAKEMICLNIGRMKQCKFLKLLPLLVNMLQNL